MLLSKPTALKYLATWFNQAFAFLTSPVNYFGSGILIYIVGAIFLLGYLWLELGIFTGVANILGDEYTYGTILTPVANCELWFEITAIGKVGGPKFKT